MNYELYAAVIKWVYYEAITLPNTYIYIYTYIKVVYHGSVCISCALSLTIAVLLVFRININSVHFCHKALINWQLHWIASHSVSCEPSQQNPLLHYKVSRAPHFSFPLYILCCIFPWPHDISCWGQGVVIRRRPQEEKSIKPWNYMVHLCHREGQSERSTSNTLKIMRPWLGPL